METIIKTFFVSPTHFGTKPLVVPCGLYRQNLLVHLIFILVIDGHSLLEISIVIWLIVLELSLYTKHQIQNHQGVHGVKGCCCQVPFL